MSIDERSECKPDRAQPSIDEALVTKIAEAIAFAEGYDVPGSRPRRNNNPGDLELDVTGKAVGRDGPYVIYGSATDGMDALKHQVRLMFGGSRVYKPSMTIAEVAARYTSTDVQAWARIVAARLGVGVETRLDDLVSVSPHSPPDGFAQKVHEVDIPLLSKEGRLRH